MDNLDSHSADIGHRSVCPVALEEEVEMRRKVAVTVMAGPPVDYHIAAAAVGKAPVEAVDRESVTRKSYTGESRPTPVSAERIAAAGKAVEAVKQAAGKCRTAFADGCMMS